MGRAKGQDSCLQMAIPPTVKDRNLLLILRPVGDSCNHRCSYCYLGGKVEARSTVMSDSVLNRVLSEAARVAERVQILWHGGEPLLASLEFFRKAVATQQSLRNTTFDNYLQTNGSLITPEAAEFFSECRFAIRLSLDGPIEIHDRYRRKPDHSGSWACSARALAVLRNAGIIPDVSCVLTDANTPHLSQLFAFFREKQTQKLALIPAHRAVSGCVPDLNLSPAAYFDVFSKLFDLWAVDHSGMSVEPFEGIVARLMGKHAGDCTFTGGCSSVVRVEPDGGVFPCELLGGELGSSLGNILDEPLPQILSRRQGSPVARLIEDYNQTACRNCEWVSLCMGGCPAAQRARNEGAPGYVYCEARIKLFTHIRDRVAPKSLIMETFSRR